MDQHIVILDGNAVNPGDLSWDGLKQFGKLTVHSHTPNDQVVQRAAEATMVTTNKTLLREKVLDRLPNLRYIGVLATGYNVVDTEAARERGITVTNIPAYSTPSVAQAVFAHILNLALHVCEHADSVRRGDWCKIVDFCYWNFPLVELQGLTLGIVGYGQIGQETAKIGRAFGMKILATNRSPKKVDPSEATMVSLDELLAQSDIVSLHCPLTEQSRGMINAEALNKMKSSAFLINTGRGPLIDEAALADALNAGRIAGAGLDVLGKEPPSEDCPLLTAKNCYITPHLAWASLAARQRLMKIAIDNMRTFLEGNPQNVVNG
jgi:glycerate dehydrogenase